MRDSLLAQFRRPVEDALRTIPPATWKDIYALSFYVSDEDDDPRRPTLRLGYNTTANWRAKTPRASDEHEAKWNYAFWLQNDILVLGALGSVSAEWIAKWIADQGLAYSDAEEDADQKRCLFGLAPKITKGFVKQCCELASGLHKDGVPTALKGEPLPILVHELEYYEEIAKQNLRANPKPLVADFVSWIRSM